MTAQYHIGDTFEVMAGLPENSVDLVLTSPPFLALRSYLPADHPNKAHEIGSEATPADFLDTLLALTAEWERLLAPHGSIAVELGDTYSGSGGGGGDYLPGGIKAGQQVFGHSETCDMGDDCSCGDGLMRESNAAHWRQKNQRPDAWPLAKSLCIIPELYAACLAYGRNVLTGTESPAGQWRVRNLVRWVRPNPPVGALGDKYRPATSTMVVACKARDRWFDLDAVRGAPADVKDQRFRRTNGAKNREGDGSEVMTANYVERVPSHPAGAPPLDWWNIPTHPYKGAHYATWPPALCERPIKSMCPQHVCRECGEPRRRVAETTNAVGRALRWSAHTAQNDASGSGRSDIADINHHAPDAAERVTLGWTDCGHDNYRPGVVLDPFAGSGTTLAVATGHGRDAIGIDLDERNADLALDRVGPMLLEVIR